MYLLATDLRKLAAVCLVSFVAERRTTSFSHWEEWCQPVRRHPYQWIWPCSGHFPFTDAAATQIQSRRSAAECSSGLCLAALRAGESEWETATELSPELYCLWTCVYHHISGCFAQSVCIKGSRRQTDHLFPSCTEVKNEWSCTSPFRTCLLCVYRNSRSYTIVTLLNIRCAQLVETLHYKPEGRGFGSRKCHRNFSLT